MTKTDKQVEKNEPWAMDNLTQEEKDIMRVACIKAVNMMMGREKDKAMRTINLQTLRDQGLNVFMAAARRAHQELREMEGKGVIGSHDASQASDETPNTNPQDGEVGEKVMVPLTVSQVKHLRLLVWEARRKSSDEPSQLETLLSTYE